MRWNSFWMFLGVLSLPTAIASVSFEKQGYPKERIIYFGLIWAANIFLLRVIARKVIHKIYLEKQTSSDVDLDIDIEPRNNQRQGSRRMNRESPENNGFKEGGEDEEESKVPEEDTGRMRGFDPRLVDIEAIPASAGVHHE